MSVKLHIILCHLHLNPHSDQSHLSPYSSYMTFVLPCNISKLLLYPIQHEHIFHPFLSSISKARKHQTRSEHWREWKHNVIFSHYHKYKVRLWWGMDRYLTAQAQPLRLLKSNIWNYIETIILAAYFYIELQQINRIDDVMLPSCFMLWLFFDDEFLYTWCVRNRNDV